MCHNIAVHCDCCVATETHWTVHLVQNHQNKNHINLSENEKQKMTIYTEIAIATSAFVMTFFFCILCSSMKNHHQLEFVLSFFSVPLLLFTPLLSSHLCFHLLSLHLFYLPIPHPPSPTYPPSLRRRHLPFVFSETVHTSEVRGCEVNWHKRV